MTRWTERARDLGRAVLLAAAVWLAGPLAAGAEPVQRSQGALTVNGELLMAPERSLGDGVILLVHGTLTHHRMDLIRGLQAGFAERGLNSLAVTLSLGINDRRGPYDCAVPHRHRHTDALGEIGGWIAWLKGKGVASIALMGHSRGGNQVAWYAAEHDDPAVTRVILLAPLTADPAALRAEYRKRAGLSVEDLLARTKGRDDAALVEVPAFLTCGAGTASAAAARSYYGSESRLDTPSLIARIPVPTLVIAGSADRVVPGLPERIAALGEEGPAEFVLIDGADHLFADLFTDEATDAVAAFLLGGQD
jgi:pimeloyl-ACP methyl ester carboxylesterase